MYEIDVPVRGQNKKRSSRTKTMLEKLWERYVKINFNSTQLNFNLVYFRIQNSVEDAKTEKFWLHALILLKRQQSTSQSKCRSCENEVFLTTEVDEWF